jgi:hypothetical protein
MRNHLLYIFCFLMTSQAVRATEVVWIALKVNDDIVTSYEVETYIENFLISPETHAFLFQKSGKNFERYQAEKRALTNKLFPTALNRLALLSLLQREALSKKDRQFFTLSKEMMRGMVENHVKQILRPYQPENHTIEEAKTAFIAQLREANIPRSPDMSDEEIFVEWTKQVKFMLREQYRQQEIFRFICSLGSCDYENPIQILKRRINNIKDRHFITLRPTPDTTLVNAEALDVVLAEEFRFSPRPLSEVENPVSRRTLFFLGELRGQEVEIHHFNDFNVMGNFSNSLGYPDTDDLGRTSGFMLSYRAEGTEGNISVELENWLFSQEIERNEEGRRRQITEEESTLRIVGRKFLDEGGKTWILMGVSGTFRSQDDNTIANLIQSSFHKLNTSNSNRLNVARDGEVQFVQGILGVGGRYSIFEHDHVDLIISGEALLQPTIGMSERNNLTIRSAIDLNFYGRNRELPIVTIGVFGEASYFSDGNFESVVGAELSIGAVYRNIYWKASLYCVRWDKEMDRRYEGEESWNFGLGISANFLNRRKPILYEFN